MVRIVLDTNVWISALVFPGGTCDKLVEHFLFSPAVQLLTSPFILEEFQRVLQIKFDFAVSETSRFLQLIREHTLIVETVEKVDVIHRDKTDNRILECALAGQADLIITGDRKHILPLKNFRGIPIRSPREVMDRWLFL